MTTDFFGGGDIANAVAVQPDGKIVVAGFANDASNSDSDFALARYNPDGTLDTSFGSAGIVTTDLGTQSDDARALAIQPDGRIVVAGTAGEDIALVRYLPDGKLDAHVRQRRLDDHRPRVRRRRHRRRDHACRSDHRGRLHPRDHSNNDFLVLSYRPTGPSTAASATMVWSRPTSGTGTTSPRT